MGSTPWAHESEKDIYTTLPRFHERQKPDVIHVPCVAGGKARGTCVRGSNGCWCSDRRFDHQESLSPAVLSLALIGIHPPVEGSGKHVMGCDCMLLLFFLFNHIFFMAMIILTSIWSLVLLLLRFWDGSHRKVDEHLGCCCWFLPYWWDKMICIIPVTWMGKSLDPVMKSVSVMLSPRPHLKRRNGDEAMDYL